MAFLTTSPATERFVSALCNTLVHSLWQGLILAAVTGLIVLFTRKHSAVMRYNLLISALALFAVGVVVTFAMQMNEFKSTATDAVTTINNFTANAAIQIDTPTPAQNFTDSLFSYLNQHHNTIVLVWFLIICAKSIQLLVGLIGVRRLKHTKVNQVTVDWYNRLQQLAHSLEIKKRIELLESGLAKVPMMIGALKPVILMPIGLLAALSIEEVEAILVHELAHIKRRDYLVNLLQSLMEIVFFFNPAVLWISQLIKAERENCCDDMVLSQSSNKVSYIRALISCEEYQAAVPAYAMSFAGDKATLMSRVKRMVSNRNHTLNLFEKTVLAVCLVVSGLCISAFGQKAQREYIAETVSKVIDNIQHQIQKPKETERLIKETDKLKEQTERLNKDEDNRAPAIVENNLPDKSRHEAATPDSSKMYVTVNFKLDSMKIRMAPMKIKINPKFKLDSMKIRMALMKLDPKFKPDSLKIHMAPMKLNLGNINISTKVKYKVDTNTYSKKEAFVTKPDGQLYKPQINRVAFAVSAPKPSPSPDTNKEIRIKMRPKFEMSDALYDAHLIKDKKNYKVILNNKEMVVNGVKQPEDVHQAFLKRYQKSPTDNVNLTESVTN